MTRDVLLKKLCPWDRIHGCCNPDANFYCDDCEPVMNEWLDKYDKQIRTEAIDDFVRFASDMPTVEEEDGIIRPMWLEEMAERLKGGR